MSFWKPGAALPGVDAERSTETEEVFVPYNSNKRLPLQQQRERLPAYSVRKEVLYAVEKYKTVVIVGQTGCGKTTQLPQYLYEAGWAAEGRIIACTQPRRVAATSIAARVAEEKGVKLGEEVGYCIQFDDRSSTQTRIKYLTDGMLVRQMMVDPLLTSYSVIMLDEAHERSLYTDIIVGLLKKVQKARGDLRIIISSATIDASLFFDFFNKKDKKGNDSATILAIPGRAFPVEIHYKNQPCPNYIRGAIDTVLEIHRTQPPGDVLVFLTGQEEIDNVVASLNEESKEGFGRMELNAVGLYASLSSSEQLKAFAASPRGQRKVVCATNIAEASVTIEGVVYVVDTGFVKLKSHHPRAGLDFLTVVPVSKASANQRAGRAGRVRPGKCFRLYTEENFGKLDLHNIPEFRRTSLHNVILQLKALGIDNVLFFDFLSPPPVEMMQQALELLFSLGAIDDNCKLTNPVGVQMAEFPLDASICRMLLSSVELSCSEEILTIAACLSVKAIFIFPKRMRNEADLKHKRFSVYEGDHITLLNVYNDFYSSKNPKQFCHENFLNFRSLSRAVEVRKQLGRFLKRFRLPLLSCNGDTQAIRKAIVAGFFANAATIAPDGSYISLRDNLPLHLHPTSVAFKHAPEWVVFHEVLQTTKMYMRDISAIDPTWLLDLAPHFYKGLVPSLKKSSSSSSASSSSSSSSSSFSSYSSSSSSSSAFPQSFTSSRR